MANNQAYGGEHRGPQWYNNGITVDIEPFTKNDEFSFKMLTLDECIGGEPPVGHVILGCVKVPELELKFQKLSAVHVIIKQEVPTNEEYHIYGFITKKAWNPELGDIEFDFVGVPHIGTRCPRDFFSLVRTRKFEKMTIKDVMDAVWVDSDRPIRWETEGSNVEALNWYQDGETDLEFLSRLGHCFNKGTIFAFDFDGMFVKDIKWKDRKYGKPEPYRVIVGNEDHPTTGSLNMNYNHKIYRDIYNPCIEGTEGIEPYGEEISKNFRLEILDDEYRIFHKDYGTPQNNFRNNRRLYDSTFLSSLSVRYSDNLPPLKLGDLVKYGKATEREEPNGPKGTISTYMVTNVHMFFAGSGVGITDELGYPYSANYIIRGIQDYRGQELPDKIDLDPGLEDDLTAGG